MSKPGFHWNPALTDPRVLDYLHDQQQTNPKHFAFRDSPFEDVSRHELVQQFEGRRRSRKKLPPWYENKRILFPAQLNLEQCSSWITAKYKADIIASFFEQNPPCVLDITGGFGVDSFAFCSVARSVSYCEKDQSLVQLVKYNAQEFDLQNLEVFDQKAETFLKASKEPFDLIYADPSRRDENAERVFALDDTEPNLKELQPLIRNQGKHLLVKTSPFLDIQQGLEVFPNTSALHIVAVGKEVKELLWWIPSLDKIQKTEIHCSHYQKDQWKTLSFDLHDMRNSRANIDPLPSYKYLFIPNPALMKAGAFQWISTHFGVNKLSPNSHLYTHAELLDFPGKKFRVFKTFAPTSKNLKSYRKKSLEVVTRNYPLRVEQLRKKFHLLPGGDTRYLVFTRDAADQPLAFEAELIS